MANNNKSPNLIKIDNVEYDLDKLSEVTRAQVMNIQFVDFRMQQLQNELAVADTARIGYTNALKNELENIKKPSE
jgi:hypothetical protein